MWKSPVVLLTLSVLACTSAGAPPATTESAAPQASQRARACFDAASADDGATQTTVAMCTAAIAEKPDHPAVMADLLLARGIAYRNQGDFPEALADFDQSLWLRSDSISTANMRAWTFREMGEYAAAEEAYSQTLKDQSLKEQVAESRPVWQAFLSRCVVRQDLDHFSLSADDCEIALQGRRDEDSLYFAARAYNRLERCAEAVPLLEEALMLEPVLSRIYGELGFAYGCIGNSQRALTVLEEGLERFPGDEGLQAMRRWVIGI